MLEQNVSLLPYNTFGIDVKCKLFGKFSNSDELYSIISAHPNEKLLILGGGSNILFTKDFDGLVLKNEISGIEITQEDEVTIDLKAGAGMVWHEFVLYCIRQGYGGIENLSLIPGTVGASPMQNIGAYGVEIKDVFVSLEALEISTGQIHTFNNLECQFGYRESIFKHSHKGKYIITSVTYRLTKKNHKLKTEYGAIKDELNKMGITSPTIQDVSNAVIAIRQSKLPDPKLIGNAGSFFKNPVVDRFIYEKIASQYENVPNYPAGEDKVKLAAGWLIENAGWKGYREGNFGVHEKQALVLVNYGETKGAQLLALSNRIIESILQKFGVQLEREVNIL